jgi:serine/threonine protein kinase
MEKKALVSSDSRAEKKTYPLAAPDYNLLEEIGKGVSAVVYRAKCIPLNEFVAIKVLDLERCNSNLVSLINCQQ